MSRLAELGITPIAAPPTTTPRATATSSASIAVPLSGKEEVWVSEYRSLEEARASIEGYLWEYNHDRPHQSLGDRTPREAFVGFESDLKSEALSV